MKFSDIFGKQEIKDRLIASVRDNRISHAQLFSGFEGSYTLPLAVAYATYIQCEKRTQTDSCGQCASCVKHAKLVHPDLHFCFPVVTNKKVKDRSPRSSDFLPQWRKAFLTNPYFDLTDWYSDLGVENKQGFISVEESADILRRMFLKSFESNYKIQIIWMPEKMRHDAANKLLKLIEEPPGNTVFILITEQREQLLPTILSRTQLVKIPRLSVNEVTTAVSQTFQIEPRLARRYAKLAGGKLNLAFSLAGEVEKEINFENEFISWMRLCYSPFHEKDGKSAWSDLTVWVDNMAKSGRENQKLFFSFCLEATRECLVVNHGDDTLVRFDEDVIPGFSKFARFIHSENVAEITDLLNKAYYAVERNANPKILLLALSFKLHSLLNSNRN